MTNADFTELDVEIERDPFLRSVLRDLTGLLQDVVGIDETMGFVSVAGKALGAELDRRYRGALGKDRFDREEVAAVLVDLKRRLEGDFYVIEQNDRRIVLGNRACPFAEHVEGRPALCMMTSNVFGHITSQHLGYAKVELQETIASGSPECRVVVHLEPGAEAQAADGRTYLAVATAAPVA